MFTKNFFFQDSLLREIIILLFQNVHVHVHFDQEFVLCIHIYKKGFQNSLLRKIIILLFQNGEHAYLPMKNSRASGALRWALDPSQLGLTLFTRLHSTLLAKTDKNFGAPLSVSQILELPLSSLQQIQENGQVRW